MSKTSFFNKAVFKRNLRGFWPLWAVYLGVMLVLIPVPIHSNLVHGWNGSAVSAAKSYCSTALTISLIVGAFFAIFATMAVFSYMYTSRSANMTASLPVKREALYATNFITVIFITFAVHFITAAAMVLSITLVSAEYLFIIPIIQWLILGFLMTTFFVCLSFFCATLTGSLLILPCMYGVINFSVILIHQVLSEIFGVFLYGYSGNSMPEIVLWLTPSVKLMNIATRTPRMAEGGSSLSFGAIPTIAIYIIIGILFLTAGLFIHKKRRTESASDIIAVKPLKPVSKFFFAAIGSLTLGILIYSLLSFSEENAVGFIISMIIGGFVGYFGSEMLVTKSFKVWHKLKGFAVYSLVVILFILGLSFDIAGFETSVPKASSIGSASVSINGENIHGDDAQTTQTAIELQEYIIEHRDDEIDYNLPTASVNISYQLKSGAFVQRYYYCNIPEFIIDYYNAPELCYERICISKEFTIKNLDIATIEFYDGNEWQVIQITDDQFYELYNRLISDIGTSSVGKVDLGYTSYVEDAVMLSAEFKISEYSGYYYYYERIPVDAKNCLEYLDYLGIEYSPVY